MLAQSACFVHRDSLKFAGICVRIKEKPRERNPDMPAQKTAHRPHGSRAAIALSGTLLAALLLCGFLWKMNPPDSTMTADLQRLSEETYSAVLLSMHSTEGFREEDFLRFRGLDTLVTSHLLRDAGEFSQYLKRILASGNAISDIYLGLDPELLWTAAGQDLGAWESSLEKLSSPMAAHPEISFSILLPYPYLDYWTGLSEEKLDVLLTLYQALADRLHACPNTKVFFPGAEEWLILNPGNYTDMPFGANDVITQSILLHTFCDTDYEVAPENQASYWARLRETIAREKVSPTRHADLSDWCIVFFGDSVLGHFPGSFSIPGYVTGLSGATTLNYAVSGTSASDLEGRPSDFPELIDSLPSEDITRETLAGKKLCFLINYGFNDYFDGMPVENPEDLYDIRSFKGSLRTCIARLQKAFPDASCILMTPTPTRAFHGGMDAKGEKGERFSDYIDAVAAVAGETGAFLIDNYHGFTISEESLDTYLPDGLHPNETGRLVIADRIIRFLEAEMRGTLTPP